MWCCVFGCIVVGIGGCGVVVRAVVFVFFWWEVGYLCGLVYFCVGVVVGCVWGRRNIILGFVVLY